MLEPIILQESVDLIDFETAIDRVIGGLEKKNKVSCGKMTGPASKAFWLGHHFWLPGEGDSWRAMTHSVGLALAEMRCAPL